MSDGFVRVAWIPHVPPRPGEECFCPICIARALKAGHPTDPAGTEPAATEGEK